MANSEESNPLIPTDLGNNDKKGSPEKQSPAPEKVAQAGEGWTVEGYPVVREPIRAQWDSSIVACLGSNDEFCSSDCEVCLLGSVAPCVLYGSNVERLTSAPGTFANQCLPYCGLYLIGNSFFGWNCLAPWFSYRSRTAIRHKFNLEGSCEALDRSCGCCGSFVEDDVQREHCEMACDFATHVVCHPCALCQEAREVRRRVPDPGFNAQQVLVMIPPREQSMGRGGV